MIQDSLVSPIPQEPFDENDRQIHSDIRLSDLPVSYLELLKNDGAGYLTKTKLPTIEPTRDGLDYVLLNGIYGWTSGTDFPSIFSKEFQPQETGLPPYFVVFLVDDNKWFCFDYSASFVDGCFDMDSANPPSIRLIDREMDQWLCLADSFDQLLAMLEVAPLLDESLLDISPDASFSLSYHQGQARLGSSRNAAELAMLLDYYQDLPKKSWYLAWLRWLLVERVEFQGMIADALLFQLDYLYGDILQEGQASREELRLLLETAQSLSLDDLSSALQERLSE